MSAARALNYRHTGLFRCVQSVEDSGSNWADNAYNCAEAHEPCNESGLLIWRD